MELFKSFLKIWLAISAGLGAFLGAAILLIRLAQVIASNFGEGAAVIYVILLCTAIFSFLVASIEHPRDTY